MQDISITISKAKQGDQDTLSILYKENYKTVLFAIRSVVRDEDEAMDILQDTFVKAFNSLEQLKDPNKFTAWVKQIAVNNALQNVKKKRPILFSQMQGSDCLLYTSIMMSLSMMKRSRQEQLILLRPTAGFLTKMSRYRKTILTNLIRNPRLRIRIIRSRNRLLSPIRRRDIRNPGLNGLIRKTGIRCV